MANYEKDVKLLLTVIETLEIYVGENWDMIAERAGYRDALRARTHFNKIKRQNKINDEAITPSDSAAKRNTSKGSATKKKATVGSSANTTPGKVTKKPITPRKRAPAPRAAKIKKEKLDEDEVAAEDAPIGEDASGPVAVVNNEDVEMSEADEDGDDEYHPEDEEVSQ